MRSYLNLTLLLGCVIGLFISLVIACLKQGHVQLASILTVSGVIILAVCLEYVSRVAAHLETLLSPPEEVDVEL